MLFLFAELASCYSSLMGKEIIITISFKTARTIKMTYLQRTKQPCMSDDYDQMTNMEKRLAFPPTKRLLQTNEWFYLLNLWNAPNIKTTHVENDKSNGNN